VRQQNLPKVSTPPRVHDATQPLPESATADMPKPGVLVAVVGNPIDGGVPTYIESLGYCVWLAAEITEEFITEDGEILTEDGIPLTE